VRFPRACGETEETGLCGSDCPGALRARGASGQTFPPHPALSRQGRGEKGQAPAKRSVTGVSRFVPVPSHQRGGGVVYTDGEGKEPVPSPQRGGGLGRGGRKQLSLEF